MSVHAATIMDNDPPLNIPAITHPNPTEKGRPFQDAPSFFRIAWKAVDQTPAAAATSAAKSLTSFSMPSPSWKRI